MLYQYYYNNNNTNYPFLITEETKQKADNCFKENYIWEDSSITLFYNLVNPNEELTILDIGACVGLYSLYAKFLPKATFYSFEPCPLNFRLLNENVVLNNISNVKTFNIAISNKNAIQIFNTCKSSCGTHTLGENPLRFSDIEQISVNCDTIDNLFYSKDIPVHFIKIDTEGWEYNIFKGGINTIKKYKPFIQLEWNETNMKQCQINPNELKNFIENEINYTIDRIIDEELFIKPKSSI